MNKILDFILTNKYIEYGVNLQKTFSIRIILLAAIGVLRYIIPRIRAWYDRGFTSKFEKTKQLTHSEYIDVYKFPIFNLEIEMAEACTTVFMVLTYAFMLPSLYVTGMLQLIVIYFRDKFLGKKFKF